jgi:hypothetical protein
MFFIEESTFTQRNFENTGGSFFYCTSLEEIVIPEPVQEIGSFAFQNCEKLRSIKIPDS